MRIGIIGSGISGNVCAYLLRERHDVTLFEANSYPGGHTNTVDVDAFGDSFAVDTGFMVYNDRTYPNLIALLSRLGISGQASDMSFSVRCDHTRLEYQGSSLGGLFAQRRNLVRPGFYGMLLDVIRFNRLATRWRDEIGESVRLIDFLEQHGFGRRFVRSYLIPMTAAIWSSRADDVLRMPARFLFAFFDNHGLLQIRRRPQWMTIPGGARRYVLTMLEPLREKLRLSTPVRSVTRRQDEVLLQLSNGQTEHFDAVIFACHADQALRLLAEPTKPEQRVLSQFRYQTNIALLHTDQGVLPRRQTAWASWNYHVSEDASQPVAVTYDLNRLQNLGAPAPICLTLNDRGSVDASSVVREIRYEHPVFGAGTLAAQAQLDQINGAQQTYFCGAYWGYGFHEDGVRSALAVCKHFGRTLDSWKAASITDKCATGASNRS